MIERVENEKKDTISIACTTQDWFEAALFGLFGEPC